MNTYYDNAATSFPKAPGVASAIKRYLEETGGPYGRSSYGRAFTVSQTVEQCREKIAVRFNISNSENIVFTANATHGINTVISGLRLSGKTVLVSPLEHNAVMRPLAVLEQKGEITLKKLPSCKDGLVDVNAINDEILKNTALIIISHMSNVNGVIQPLQKIKEAAGSIPVLVDAAQSAGHVPIDVEETGIDFLALTGHKGLLGPTGTGALYLSPEYTVGPLLYGGTGSRSESVEMPDFMPDRFEAGTPNIAGIFGLHKALEYNEAANHSHNDLVMLIESLKSLSNLKVYCAENCEYQGGLFSIVPDGRDLSEFSTQIYTEYGIETRIGLHCSPTAHEFLGTKPAGTIRIAPSQFHTTNDFAYLIGAVKSSLE